MEAQLFRDAEASLPLLKQAAPTACTGERFAMTTMVGAPAFMRGSSAFKPSGRVALFSSGFSRGISVEIAAGDSPTTQVSTLSRGQQ
jgi:hypothetical protein